jgi:hypothetical protein
MALPQELDRIGRIGFRDRGPNPCVGKRFQRLRVEIDGEIGGARIGLEDLAD